MLSIVMLFIKGNSRPLIIGAAVVAVVLGVWLYGNSRYKAGVTETTNEFIQADRKGADNVTETAEKILRDSAGLDDDAIADSLRRSGGFRPDTERDVPATE